MKDSRLLASEINDALVDFVYAYKQFDEAGVNNVPFDGSWTPAQVAQHIILADSGFAELLNGPVTDTQRNPEAGIENIEARFLNFDIKMQSPDFILPPAKNYDQQEQLNMLNSIKENFTETIPGMDMVKTCTGFKLPVMGYITRIEAATFVIVHTIRHTYQLNKIYNHIYNHIKTIKNNNYGIY